MKVMKTLAVHTDRVNTVKWIKRGNEEPEFELISGSDDSKCIFWNIKDIDDARKTILAGHESSVTSVDTINTNGEITVATTSADSTVRLWRFNPDEQLQETVECFQVIDLFNGICFEVKFCLLPNAGILLAVATDDDNIHFYGENHSMCFEKVESLTGHEDWVRGLDFSIDDNGDLLLASSSQDSFIRIWRISPKTKGSVSDSELIQVDEKNFIVAEQKFTISLDSVLQAHEGWVYGVHWNRNVKDNSLQLLSSSIDKTMIIWTIDKEQNLWTEKIRVGDVGENLTKPVRQLLATGFSEVFTCGIKTRTMKNCGSPE
jgi:elongator complex protein 2